MTRNRELLKKRRSSSIIRASRCKISWSRMARAFWFITAYQLWRVITNNSNTKYTKVTSPAICNRLETICNSWLIHTQMSWKSRNCLCIWCNIWSGSRSQSFRRASTKSGFCDLILILNAEILILFTYRIWTSTICWWKPIQIRVATPSGSCLRSLTFKLARRWRSAFWTFRGTWKRFIMIRWTSSLNWSGKMSLPLGRVIDVRTSNLVKAQFWNQMKIVIFDWNSNSNLRNNVNQCSLLMPCLMAIENSKKIWTTQKSNLNP